MKPYGYYITLAGLWRGNMAQTICNTVLNVNCDIKMYRWTFLCVEEAVGSDELSLLDHVGHLHRKKIQLSNFFWKRFTGGGGKRNGLQRYNPKSNSMLWSSQALDHLEPQCLTFPCHYDNWIHYGSIGVFLSQNINFCV